MERIRLIVRDLHCFAYPSDYAKEESFRLTTAIGSALRFTSHTAKDITINNLIDKDYWVVGSKSHIIRVLINLVSNSQAALLDRNAAMIKINAQIEMTSQGEKVIIEVWDNGSGIEPSALEKVFDPFYTTKEIGAGLGMGLGICSTIIQNHGGTLKVASVLDNFTSCTFDLALAPQNRTT
ncbi:MAG: two-component system sensor histidine kinase PhcS [Saprospiraceae bacterium]|jgi:two-component system sensor histidine kinase PhcS